jgi:hypothetical protein
MGALLGRLLRSLMMAELVDVQIVSYLGNPEIGMGEIPKNTLSRAR